MSEKMSKDPIFGAVSRTTRSKVLDPKDVGT